MSSANTLGPLQTSTWSDSSQQCLNPANAAWPVSRRRQWPCAISFEHRAELQESAQREADLLVGGPRRKIYAPLSLFVRARRGGLEICWQEVHCKHRTGGATFRYLRRGRDGDYAMTDLLRRAKPFERKLVELCESRARKLRALWRESSKLRRGLRTSLRQARVHRQNAASWPASAHETRSLGRRT